MADRTPDPRVIERLAHVHGWVLDVDGCLVRTASAGGAGGVAIDGAVEFVRWLQNTGQDFVICTNASQKPLSRYADHLRNLGFDIGDDDMMTAATAAAAYIAHAHPGERVLALGDTGLFEALDAEGMSCDELQPDKIGAVVVGAADQYTTKDINAACLAIADHGAAFYVSVITPWFFGGMGKSVAVSTAIANAITSVTGVSPTVCGKPSPALAELLTRRLGGDASRIAVVGDMAPLEILMAHQMGATGVLVLSGGTTPDQVPNLPPEHQPHLSVADVGALLTLLQNAQEY